MSYFKITSDITRVASGKAKMDVEFYNDAGDKIGNTELGFEVDADTDEGIKAALSQAAKDRTAAASVVVPTITLAKDQLIEAE